MKLSKAIIYSLIAHVLMIVLLAFNYQFSKVDIKQSKAPRQINATSVNAENVRKHFKKLKQKDINKRNKDIERLRKLKKQEDDSRKKRIEEEQKVKKAKQRQKDAEKKRKVEEKKTADAKKKRITDEKARKKKIALDKKKTADARKKAEAEAKRKRKQKEKAEKKRKEEARKKKLAEEKAAQDALEKEMEQQMADEAAALDAAQQQQVLNEVDKYVSLITGKIKRNWIKPEKRGYCIFRINLVPGGLVMDVSVLQGDKQHCDSGQRAIYKAEPLPVSSDPDVFAELKAIRLTLGEQESND